MGVGFGLTPFIFLCKKTKSAIALQRQFDIWQEWTQWVTFAKKFSLTLEFSRFVV